MEKMRKKLNGRFSTRLTRVILLLVSVTFLVTFLVFAMDVSKQYRIREIESQRSQLNKTAAQIKALQSTIKNISLLIVYNDNVQTKITDQNESSGKLLYAVRNVNDTLSEYLHIMEGTEEIMIYTTDGRTYTSRYTRGNFNPEKTEWYQRFLKSGRKSGYTQVHRSVPTSGGYTIDVISYVTNYYSITNIKEKLGELFINMDFTQIQKMVNLDSTMLTGYCLYDSDGNPLIEHGSLHLSCSEILKNSKNGIFKQKSGEVYVVSQEMEDGWTLVSEISAKALMQQSFLSLIKMMTIFVGIWVILAFALRYFIGRMVRPINELSKAVSSVGKGNFETSVEVHTEDEIENLANTFNKMVIDINVLMKESVEHQKNIQKMQTENLMLQINPHFIYNTMNSIVYMAKMSGNPDIADFTNAFISLLQNTLRVRNSIYSTVEEELKTVQSYLYLQEFRYGNKFTYDIQCETELLDCQVLNVMLQPVVENAIFHGIAPKNGVGKIKIMIRRAEQFLELVVEDDGVGMSRETMNDMLKTDYIQKSGIHKIGIGNVKQRILDIYGVLNGLDVESTENVGTRIIMRIPFIKTERIKDKTAEI